MFRIASLKNNIVIVLCCCLLFSCKEKTRKLPYYNTPDFTPLFIDEATATKQITHTVANFSFTDQNGKVISQKNIEGKIHIANFFFTSCGSICPVMMKNMARVDAAFKNDTDVVLLSYSVTPWIDTQERLNKYALVHNYSNVNWHLLTGDKSVIYQLARQSYFAEEDIGFNKDSTGFLHTEHIILVDKYRHIRGIYNGTLQLDAQQLITDITELEKE